MDTREEIEGLQESIAAGTIVTSTDGTTTTNAGLDDQIRRINYLEELERKKLGLARRRPTINRIRLG